MKLVKRWLFPVLTCLIIVGAAVLPAQFSQAQDARLFGQVHTEELDADPLPAAQAPTLLDRIALYSSRYSSEHPILSYDRTVFFDDPEEARLMQSVQDQLIEAEVLPVLLFEVESKQATQLLLWDPEQNDTFQTPSLFWRFSWSLYYDKNLQKKISVTVDDETGLPIELNIHDPGMSQWLPYDTDHLRTLSEHFFDLLGVEVQETDLDGPKYAPPSLNLSCSIAGTEMNYFVSRAPADLYIQLDITWQLRTEDGSISVSYDE